MGLIEELTLLVKSKYQLIYLESADEEYVLGQLEAIAERLRLVHYRWSVTGGLRRANTTGPYYQTNDPGRMLITAGDLVRSGFSGPGLFVLTDFHKYLENDLVLRQFKDLLAQLKNQLDTVVIIAPEYKLPVDIESYAAHIVGGYPDELEIAVLLKEITENLARGGKKPRIELTQDETRRIVAALRGLSLHQIRSIIHQVVLEDNLLSGEDLKDIADYKKKVFDREGFLEYHGAACPDEIAGFGNLKHWLSERSQGFTAENNGIPPPKGLLLLGVQGCGKSLAVRAIAGVLRLPLYQLEISRLYGQYIGQTEQNLRKALATAEKLSPMCLWIDEIEKGFAASDGQADGGVSQRVLGLFLTWMQERKALCFVAATANNIYNLPPEFLRKGRFDEVFFVDLPGRAEREALFRIHLRKRRLDPDRFDVAALSERTSEFSGAEIEQLVIAALYGASYKKEPPATGHIMEKIDATKPLAVIKAEEIAALREWARERTVPA